MTATTARRAWVRQIMGLPVSVHVRGAGATADRAAKHVDAFFADLSHADDVFSTYRPDSRLSRWERGELDDADPAMAEVFGLCRLAGERTDGWFDARGLPDPGGAGPRFDPSGLVKGWAVERAARHLADLDGPGWCVNAGGDVLLHTADGEPPWRVGVEDPADPGRLLRAVTVTAGAVATSGTVHRGAHIVDPYTANPATAVRAVTVLGPSLLWADVYATASAARGPGALDWLAGVPAYDALLVGPAGEVTTTAGWPAA